MTVAVDFNPSTLPSARKSEPVTQQAPRAKPWYHRGEFLDGNHRPSKWTASGWPMIWPNISVVF